MIRTAADGPLRVVTVDRPARRNALRPADLTALESAVRTATEPVLYLRGAGSAFCAGADLDFVEGLDEATAAGFARHGQRVAAALSDYDGATVAGVDGPARGGGVELALACDVRLASPDASFAETGVRLGIFGAWGGTARLPAIVGLGEAMDLELSGRTVDAAAASEMGLVSRVVEDPRAVAREIADNDGQAVRVLKARLRDDADRATQEDREVSAFTDLIGDSQP
jgi:enoyl-CoA hydratase/carnithine racemase